MAKYTNEIHYNVTTDFKDNGLNKLNQEIINIQNKLQNLKLDVKDSGSIDKITEKLDRFRDAINQSYNFRLKTTDLNKMQRLLEQSGTDVRQLAKDFASLGNQGRIAFMQINNELTRFMTQAKSVSAVTQKIWNTVGNTVRWGIISNGFQSVLDSVSRATGYVKELDRSLTDIRLVSNYNAKEMQRFAEQANKAAKALGSTTVAYTDASAIFVQQGMSLKNAEKMADLTIKVSNITGQTTSEVSEQITAWMNGYQLQAEELQRTLDSVVKVAAVSAADTEEIMTAASKVASTASTVGVSTDQLVAQMSTIISVTREAPEAVGNAMKTIYSRLSSLKLGETLEDNVTLNSMTKTLEKIGVQVLDDNNNLRDMGTIIEELQQKWVDLSEAQKMAASVQLAGRYQLNRFLALMNNQDYYKDMMSAAENATGFLNEKQAVYLESLEGHLATLKASIESIATVGLDTDDFNDFLEVLTNITDNIGTTIDAIGGFGPLLEMIGPILLKTFSNNIADSVMRFGSNLEQASIKIKNVEESTKLARIENEEILDTFKEESESAQDLIKKLKELNQLRMEAGTNLSLNAQKELNEMVDQGTESLDQYTKALKEVSELQAVFNTLSEQGFIKYNEQGNLEDFYQNFSDRMKKEGYLTPRKKGTKVNARGAVFLEEMFGFSAGETINKSWAVVSKQVQTHINKIGEQLKKGEITAAEYSAKIKAAAEATGEFGDTLKSKNIVASLSKTIGAFGQAAMGVQMFSAAIKTFLDQTIEDPVERFNQGIIDLSFSLGMLLPLLSDEVDKMVKKAKETEKVIQLQKELNKAQKDFNELEATGRILNLSSTIEYKKLNDAQKAYNKGVREAVKSGFKSHLSNLFQGVKNLATGFIDLIGNMHPVGKIILGIAAAVSVATAAFYAFNEEARNKRALEEFTKKIQEQTAATGEVADNLKEIMSTLTDYKDAKDALQELTVGSEAWAQQINTINGIVDGLLEKFPELSKYVTLNDNGEWTLNTEGAEEGIVTSLINNYRDRNGIAYGLIDQPKDQGGNPAEGVGRLKQSGYDLALGLQSTGYIDYSDYGGVAVAANMAESYSLKQTRTDLEKLLQELASLNLDNEDDQLRADEISRELLNFKIPGLDIEAFKEALTINKSARNSDWTGTLHIDSVEYDKEALESLINGLTDEQILGSGRGQYNRELALTGGENQNGEVILSQLYGERQHQIDTIANEINNASEIHIAENLTGEEVVEALFAGKKVTVNTGVEELQLSQIIKDSGLSSYINGGNVRGLIDTRDQNYSIAYSSLSPEEKQKIGNIEFSDNDTSISKDDKVARAIAESFNVSVSDVYDLVDAIGGIESFFLSIDAIRAQVEKGTKFENIANEIDISEFYLTIDELDEAIKGYFGEADTLIKYYTDNIIQAQGALGNEINEDQARQVLAQKSISTNAAQRLAEGYEENFANLNSTNGDTANFARDFFATNIADLFGIPVEQITYEMIDEINKEGLLNEGLWEKDSETIRQIVSILDGAVNFNTQGHEYYNVIQDRIAKNNIDTETIVGELEDAGVDLNTDRGQTLLRLLGLQDIGENGEHLFVPLEIGIATVEQALDDFAQALIATGKTEEEARDIAAEQNERIKNLDLTEDQQQQILTAAIQNPDLLLADDKYLDNLIAQSQEGIYSFSDLLDNMIRQVNIETKNITPDIIQDWAQEMGLSVEDLDIKAHQLMQENEGKFENVKDAIIDIYETWTNEQAQIQEARNNAIENLTGINESDTQENIESILDKFDNEEELEEFISYRALHAWDTIGTAYENFQNELLQQNWYKDSDKAKQYIEDLDLDWEEFQRIRQGYKDRFWTDKEAAEQALQDLQDQAAALKEQEEAYEKAQKYIERQDDLVAAQQAMIGFNEQYTATGQFGNLNNIEDFSNFSQQFATAIGTTEEALKAAWGESYDARIKEIAGSEAFVKAVQGDASDLIAMLAGWDYEVTGDIKTVFDNFFQFMEQAQIELNAFGQALLNAFPDMSGQGAKKFEGYYQQNVNKLGLSQDVAEEYLTTALNSGYTDLVTEEGMTRLAEAAQSSGASILEALAQEISERDFNANKWANSYEGTEKIASQFDKTREQFDDEAKELFPDLETIQEQRIALYNLLKEQDESYQAQLQQTIETLHNNNPSENVKDIEKLLSELSEEELALFTAWDEVNGRGKSTEESLAAWQESRDQTLWSSSEAGQQKYFKENNYSTEDEDKYNQYLQEEIDNYIRNLVLQSNGTFTEQTAAEQISDNAYQQLAEQAAQRVEEERSLTEAAEERLAQEQRQINAQQAIKELYKEYSEEGFSLDDPVALQNIRKQLASIFDMTAEELETALGEGGLEKLVNSDAFKDFMSGDKSAIANLENVLREAGLNVDELDISLEDLFVLAQQGIEEVEKTLQETISDILQIIKNISEGDTVSDDQYKLLVEQLGQEAVDQYFTTMADGTHMLIGIADEFKQNAMAITRGKIVNQLGQDIGTEQRELHVDESYSSEPIQTDVEQLFSTADTLEDLQALKEYTEKLNVSQDITFNAYNDNLVRLAMNYENAADELEKFRNAQTDEERAAAQRDLEGSIAIGQDKSLDKLGLDASEVDNYADHLQDLAASEEDAYVGAEILSKDIVENEKAAADLSKQILRMNKGIESLEKNWDDWADVLQNSSEGSEEYFDAMQDTRKAMSDLLNISEDFISSDFINNLANTTEGMELMQRAAEGDGDAIDALRQQALEDIILHLNLDDTGLTNEEFLNKFNEIQNMVDAIGPITAGTVLDNSGLYAGAEEFINALNTLILEAGLTKDEVNALLSGMGFTANFASEPQVVKKREPDKTITHVRKVSKGSSPTTVVDAATGETKTGSIEEYDIETTTETIPGEEVEGEVDAYSLETSEPGTTVVPKINSLTKAASGSANNYSSSNRGGNGGGGKGSGGGGGGKGGGGSSKKNQADPIEKEKDRYQKVNEQIAKTVAEYDQLTEAQDRLLGPELAMNLEEQNEKLEEQIDLQKEKLRIQREEQRDRQKDLSQYGIQFNPDGTISNYSEVWDAQNAKLEAARQAYNGTDTDDEAAKEAWEAAQAYFDDFAEGITKYDSLLESIYDTNSELQNLRNAIDDLSKSIVETAYDSLNSLQDLDDTMAEVRLNLSDPFGDDIWKQLESATDRLSDWFQMDEEDANTAYNSLINQAQKLMDKTTDKAEKESLQRYIDNASNDLNSGSTGYLDMWNAQTNNLLKEYNDLMTTGSNKSGLSAGSLHELMDTAFGDGAEKLGSLVDQLQKARDLALDAMDEINDKFEDRKEQYEVINDELEHQLELSEMLHGDQAYAEQEKVLQAQLNNSKGQLGIAAEQVKLYEAWSKNAIEGTEEWKKANELLTDAQKDYNEQVEKAVELTQKLYENTINSQLDKWIQNALGNDMDWVQEEWELIQRNAEQYLDDVEKAYNIQKLQNSYEDLLNQSNQLDIQQQITDQMNQQLGYLRGKTQLSKYDVDYANAQLEILQRQIALEEARRNKNQMRLSRDAQGNYSYVYTANRDDVNNAESGLLDAQFNAYNLSKQNIIDSQSNALSALNDFYSSAQAIATNYNLSEEERAARLQSLWDYNREYLQGCAEQLGTSFENIQNDFYGMVDALEDINEGNLTEWTQRLKDGTMDMTMVMSEILSDAIFDWLTKFENFELDTYAVISQMLDSWNEYTTGLTDMGASVGETIGDITEATQQCVEQTNKLTESQSGFFDLLEKQAGTVDNYLTQMQGYADTIANLEGQMSQYKDNMEKLEKILRENYISYELNGELVDNSKKPSGGNGGNGKGGSGNGSGGKGSGAGGKTSNGTKFTNEELIEGVAGNIWTYGSWANDPTRAGDLAKKFGADMAVAIQQFVNRGMEALTHDWTTGYYRQFGIDAFATGGYTGSWDGGDGKLAILDSKELVLNAKDTENMLAAVNLVREVVRSMQGTTLSSGLSSLNGAFSSAASTVDQNVTITANFPNATSESEIKSAILGLVDQSVQYSARTKPTGKVF